MSNNEYKRLYDSLSRERDRHKPLWDTISKYVGITTQSDYHTGTDNKSEQLDQYIDDPTAATSVNQAGDYLVGLLWGTGDDAMEVLPSDYVTELVDDNELKEWYEYATKRSLYHVNHDQSGFINALRPYSYDQWSFGTSGLGCFKNKDYLSKFTDCALSFKMYGVDNLVIGEGSNSLVDTVFVKFWWDGLRIQSEFPMIELPEQIQACIGAGDYNKRFPVVFGMVRNNEFESGKRGKKGAKYKGVWFLDEGDNSIFYTEYFNEKPITVCRQIKMRNELYGRSCGTLLISTIRAVNYMIGNTIEIMEKMNLPALGVFSNALFGDAVMDDSSGSLTTFNPQQIGSQSPVFPLYTVGDPSAIINFLLPYLNEKIVTAFKIDQLLDFNSGANMSATESMHRFTIRGQSLFGMLVQQKVEAMMPIMRRAVTLLYDVGELGVDPRNSNMVSLINKVGRGERIIPEAVIQVAESGKPWFNLQFNTEMEKLTRTDAVDDLLKMLNSVSAIATMYPQIIDAVDWYKMLKDINERVTPNAQILLSAQEFKGILQQQAQQAQQQMQLNEAEQGSKAMFNVAQAQAVTDGMR